MDTAVGSLIALIAIAAALLYGFRWLVRSFSRYRGSRIVTCPETKKPAIVEVDSLHASLTSTVGLPGRRRLVCFIASNGITVNSFAPLPCRHLLTATRSLPTSKMGCSL